MITIYVDQTGAAQLNLLKNVGTQQSNKTHFYCKKLTFYDQLIKLILWGQVPSVPSLFHCLSPYKEYKYTGE